jgi:copper chaperone CopZ
MPAGKPASGRPASNLSSDRKIRFRDRKKPLTRLPMTASQTMSITISGMTCPSCAKLMESDFRDVPGVAAATVTFDPKTGLAAARATFAAPATADSLKDAVRRAGYAFS